MARKRDIELLKRERDRDRETERESSWWAREGARHIERDPVDKRAQGREILSSWWDREDKRH